jgi:hypothetical protein
VICSADKSVVVVKWVLLIIVILHYVHIDKSNNKLTDNNFFVKFRYLMFIEIKVLDYQRVRICNLQVKIYIQFLVNMLKFPLITL